jgi:anti-sigma factor RsiW
MRCKRVVKNLAAYLDNELGAGKVRRVKEHLARCSACRLRETELRRSWSLLDTLRPVNAPAGFALRIAERVRGAQELLTPYSHPGRVAKYIRYALAAGVLLAIVLYLLVTPTAQEPPVLTELQTEVVSNLELLENLEILENPELLKELDILLDYEEEDFESS